MLMILGFQDCNRMLTLQYRQYEQFVLDKGNRGNDRKSHSRQVRTKSTEAHMSIGNGVRKRMGSKRGVAEVGDVN